MDDKEFLNAVFKNNIAAVEDFIELGYKGINKKNASQIVTHYYFFINRIRNRKEKKIIFSVGSSACRCVLSKVKSTISRAGLETFF